MSIIFKYVKVPRPDGTLRNAPYIPVWIRTKTGKLIDIAALIDSGADTTVIPKDLALLLGLKESRVESETGGIGGKVKVRESKLAFRIKGKRESYSLDVPVLVLQDNSIDVPLILGRHGFFEHFEITFKQVQGRIVLKKLQQRVRY